MKTERDFVKELEARAREQRQLVRTQVLPIWARGLGDWLTVNPWRVLVPASTILYITIRLWYGAIFREFILGLFGGFA